MINKDGRHFHVRKVYPKEAVALKDSIKERFQDYIEDYFDEKTYVEVKDLTAPKREMRFDVIFQKAPTDTSVVNSLIDEIVCLVMIDLKTEADTSKQAHIRDNVTRLVERRSSGSL